MKAIVPLLGWALFLFCFASFVSDFGARWEFGRYGMPRTLVAADGCSYPDGTPIPAPILSFVRADVEEEWMLALLLILGGSLIYLWMAIRAFRRAARDYRDTFGRDFERR